YDPHDPYRAPEPYASRYAPYDAEVAYTDAMLGRLLDELRAAGQLDRTLVVVAADHGESLGEHGERTHGVFAYDVTLRVPWIIWAGSRASAGASNVLARLIDLTPTTLDIVGVDRPAGFEGRSLMPALAGSGETPQTADCDARDANLTRNWAPLTGVISGSDKLIDLPRPELYDLERDPKEATNLFTSKPEQARTLGVLLRETAGAFGARAAAPEKTTLSADARQ